MRCPRCNGYAEPYLHYEQGLDAGTFCDWYLRCLICGEYIWQARLQVIITAAEIAAEFAWRGGIRQACTVKGCPERIQINHHATNPEGMCKKHHHRWFMHQYHKAKSPSPLIKLDSGEWIENPKYQRRGNGRASNKGTCGQCGKKNITIAIRHPLPLCGVCNNLSRGLSAGGKVKHGNAGNDKHQRRSPFW